MKAILMAAGVGSRLGKAVNGPKCLLDVAGKPLICRTVEMLKKYDIEVAVTVGYKKENIIRALNGLDVAFFFNPFFKVTNSMASLWFARDFIDEKEDIILGNADVFWNEDVLKQLLSAEENAVMMVDTSRVEVGDYFFRTNDRQIMAFGKDLPVDRRDCEYVGLARLKADFIPGFKERLNKCVEDEVYDLWWENVLYNYCEEYPIYALDVDGRFWGEIDYIEDYARILDYVRDGRC